MLLDDCLCVFCLTSLQTCLHIAYKGSRERERERERENQRVTSKFAREYQRVTSVLYTRESATYIKFARENQRVTSEIRTRGSTNYLSFVHERISNLHQVCTRGSTSYVKICTRKCRVCAREDQRIISVSYTRDRRIISSSQFVR
jgi:hypothetical protein